MHVTAPKNVRFDLAFVFSPSRDCYEYSLIVNRCLNHRLCVIFIMRYRLIDVQDKIKKQQGYTEIAKGIKTAVMPLSCMERDKNAKERILKSF